MSTQETSPAAVLDPSVQLPGAVMQPVSDEQVAFDVVRNSLDNEELIHVVGRYIYDEEPTDIQRMLKDADARPRVIREVSKIGEVANWSIAEALLDSSDGSIEGSNFIQGSQVTVDAMSEKLRTAGSALFKEEKYKLPSDPEYWTDEAAFIEKRKQSGDARWLSTDSRESAESLREEAAVVQGAVEGLLNTAIAKAGVESTLVRTSQRVKGVDSLLGKVSKFKETEWGADATVADAVDLIGGRIVVEDLDSLERVMLSLESMDESGDIQVLRKENKFIANDGSTDPYRALHYVVAIPGTLQAAEIQVKTLSSMVASDLYHNAVYKPHLLNLPGELRESIRAYNWRSVDKEMEDYLVVKGISQPQASTEARSEKTDVEFAINELNYNAFYDLVVSNINSKAPLTDETKNILARFHEKETQKLNELMVQDESLVLILAAAAHNAYYDKAVADMVENVAKPQLGNAIDAEALSLLPEGGRARYMARFDNFDGSNNKFTALDLSLDQLDDATLKTFFTSMGKDTARSDGKLAELLTVLSQHREGVDQTEYLNKVALVNLYHASFDELLSSAEDSNGVKYAEDSPQTTVWKEALVSSQVKAIAASSLLTEIGGYDARGQFRDVTAKVFEGSDYSVRDFMTFAIFVAANRATSEFSETSYADFVTDPNSEWARDFDKVIDTAIMHSTINTQMNTLNKMVAESQSNVQLARLQKARLELFVKNLRFNGKYAEAEQMKPVIKQGVVGILDRKTQVSQEEINAEFNTLVAQVAV